MSQPTNPVPQVD